MKMQVGRQTGFLLGGKDWNGEDGFEVRSPWDGGLIGRVARAERKDAREAVRQAYAALRRTRRMARWMKREILTGVADALEKQRDRFVKLLVAEAGKPIRAAHVEVDRAIFTFRMAAEELTREAGEVVPLDLMPENAGRFARVERVAAGVVLAITPYHFPLNLVAHKVASAIAAGCPVIVKPASETPFTALALGELVVKAGWPPDALSVLTLTREETAHLVEKDELIRVVSFTGSTATGWELKQRAGRKKVTLELGGNAALIVHSDWGPELDEIVDKVALSAFGQAGQSSVSTQRVFVERRIYQTFLWKLVESAKSLSSGDPWHKTTVVGPMICASDADRVMAWAKEAANEGAKVVSGEFLRKGNVIEPIVLTATKPEMKVQAEEIFGPVVCVEPYDDFEEALAMVNHSRFGLQAGVMTRDAGRIEKAYRELEVGAVLIGEVPSWRLDSMPYGGVKESGMGRAGLRWAIAEMTEPRMLVMSPMG